MKRRCAFIPAAALTERRVVWARNGAIAEACPRSLVTAESMAWLEEFAVRLREGSRTLLPLEARKAEAFLALESEMAKEGSNESESF